MSHNFSLILEYFGLSYYASKVNKQLKIKFWQRLCKCNCNLRKMAIRSKYNFDLAEKWKKQIQKHFFEDLPNCFIFYLSADCLQFKLAKPANNTFTVVGLLFTLKFLMDDFHMWKSLKLLIIEWGWGIFRISPKSCVFSSRAHFSNMIKD